MTRRACGRVTRCGRRLQTANAQSHASEVEAFWGSRSCSRSSACTPCSASRWRRGSSASQAIAFVREQYGRDSPSARSDEPFQAATRGRDLVAARCRRPADARLPRLFVDFEASSLWNRAYIFKDVTRGAEAARRHAARRQLQSRRPRVARRTDRRRPMQRCRASGSSRSWSSDGAIAVIGPGARRPLERQFHAVDFSLKDFRTTPEGGEFGFGGSEPGRELRLEGTIRAGADVRRRASSRIDDLQAPDIGELLDDALPFSLARARSTSRALRRRDGRRLEHKYRCRRSTSRALDCAPAVSTPTGWTFRESK